ncbi:putative HAD superfamily hydrolase [Xylona heveae TC161]|uniref:Putative HAD superfamily hydrolase n=1 Tax=Xylona heveae (strain CBS 132557 / TC161) TaxID=1328760 RepID=A0A164ZM39_XYLHT|nr:putative HAD superfamily hydrolase [Xylona heveae TC161]KZF19266.1 putative HAD superfamily hydrolase [Xylona heveae TC161]
MSAMAFSALEVRLLRLGCQRSNAFAVPLRRPYPRFPQPSILGAQKSTARAFQTSSNSPRVPDFAFAFDIDGVLLRSSSPLPRAHKALSYLQEQGIPFILLTNGGGKSETDRVAELSKKLDVPLDLSMFVQSHTPFAQMVEGDGVQEGLRDKCIMVVGGDGDKCRQVAEKYGFRNVVTPGDIIVAHPSIWPFSYNFMDYYKKFARPLPRPIDAEDPSKSLKIDAIFVYNDPRDWAADAQIVLDVLLSSNGVLGTYSSKNNDPSLPNRGYLQDGQPPLYYSNPDLLWAAAYHLPRLGQGGFREALDGVWAAVTGGPQKGVDLHKQIMGKPYQGTYEFAEKLLISHRQALFPKASLPPLKRVFMIGDNPESDIQGGNNFKSPIGSEWYSLLLRTGVYQGGEPAHTPRAICDDVWDAVRWGLNSAGWGAPKE